MSQDFSCAISDYSDCWLYSVAKLSWIVTYGVLDYTFKNFGHLSNRSICFFLTKICKIKVNLVVNSFVLLLF